MKPFTILLIFACWIISNPSIAQNEGIQDNEDYVPFDVYYDEILQYYGEKRLEKIKELEEAIAEGRTEEDPFIMAYVYLMKGRDLANDNPTQANKVADKLYDNAGRYGRWTELQSVQGTAYAFSYIIRGYASWVGEGDKDMAKMYFDSAALEYANFYSEFYRGWLLHTEGDLKGALARYQKSESENIALSIDISRMHENQAKIYTKMKLSSKVIEQYTKAFEAYPLCTYLYKKAETYFYSPTTSDKTLAYEEFETILKECGDGALSDSNMATVHSNLANKYFNESNWSKAAYHHSSAFNFYESHFDAAYAASAYMAQQNNYQAKNWATKSINAARNANEIDKKALGEAYLIRGYVYLVDGEMSSAKSDLQNGQYYGNAQAAEYLSKYF